MLSPLLLWTASQIVPFELVLASSDDVPLTYIGDLGSTFKPDTQGGATVTKMKSKRTNLVVAAKTISINKNTSKDIDSEVSVL